MDNIIKLIDISRSFENKHVLRDLNLYTRNKELLILLGPSDYGKTATLKLIARFETPDTGKIMFEGKSISNITSYKRDVNMVFQKYALLPNMNIFENIVLGLRIKGMNEKLIREKVTEVLKLMSSSGFEKRKINNLSGGQQQGVAIARTLVNEPDVLLLGGPLSALDLKLRKGMQNKLKSVQERAGITFVYIARDQEEALTTSDTIVVIENGITQQVGTPEDVYSGSRNKFIAKFIGESNIIDGVFLEDCMVESSNHKWKCVDKGSAKNEDVQIAIRPEDAEIVAPEKGQIKDAVINDRFKGIHYEMPVNTGDLKYKTQLTINKPQGGTVGINIGPDNIHIMEGCNDEA